MRGVVTLAAAFLLPVQTPQRDLLQLGAFVVVAGTLLIQGLTLPWLMRRLGLRGPTWPRTRCRRPLVTGGPGRVVVLEERATDDDPPKSSTQLHERADAAHQPDLGAARAARRPNSNRRRRCTAGCGCRCWPRSGRQCCEARDSGGYDDEVLRAALAAIDLEESMLDRVEDAAARIDDELRTRAARRRLRAPARGTASRRRPHPGRV